MDNQQDHQRNPSPVAPIGHESHGAVHLCHKCGWPFPNPHPSARDRRAHKRVCGYIEGYRQFVGQGETEIPPHSPGSDNEQEHLSDEEDFKTPSARMLERSKSGGGGLGGRSSRSEDDIFSDAVAEFTDDGSALGIEENAEEFKDTARKEAITTAQLPECNTVVDNNSRIQSIPDREINKVLKDAITVIQEKSLIDSGIKDSARDPCRNEEVHADDDSQIQSILDRDINQELKDATTVIQEKLSIDSGIKDSARDPCRNEEDRNSQIKSIPEQDINQEFKDATTVIQEKSLIDSRIKDSARDPCRNGEDGNSQIQSIPDQGFYHEFKDATTVIQEKSSTESGIKDSARDPCRNEEGSTNVVRCLEKQTASEENRVNNAGEGTVKTNESISDGNPLEAVTSNNNVDEAKNSLYKVGKEETYSDVIPSDEVVQLKEGHSEVQLSLPVNDLLAEDKSNQEINSDAYIAQMKVDNAETKHSDSSGNVVECESEYRESSENVDVLSIPDNIPAVANPDIMIKGFKDHGGKLQQLTVDESLEVIGEMKTSLPRDNPFLSLPSEKDGMVSSTDMPLLEDNLELKDGKTESIVAIHDRNFEIAEISLHKNSQVLENLGILPDYASIGVENICANTSVQHPHASSSNLSEITSQEHAISVQSELNTVASGVQSTIQVESNIGDEKKAKTTSDAAEPDYTGIPDQDGRNNIVATSRSTDVLSVLNIDERGNLNEVDDGHIGEDKIQVKDISSTDERRNLNEVDDRHIGEGKTQVKDVSGTDILEVGSSLRRRPATKNLSVNTGTPPVCTSVQELEFQLVSEDKVSVSETKPADSEATQIKRVLGSQECQNKHESRNDGYLVPGSEAGNANPSREPVTETLLKKTKLTAESGTANIGGKIDLSRNSQETESGNVSTPECSKESESKVHPESQRVGKSAVSDTGSTGQVKEISTEDHTIEEPQSSPSDAFKNRSPSVDVSYAEHSFDLVATNKSEPLPSNGTFDAQQLGTSATEFAVDSGSQDDSLDGHWGSISVLSTQSDVHASVEGESLPINGHCARGEAEKPVEIPKAPTEGQTDKSEMFEPPSFMTLVEPKAAGNDQKAGPSNIKTANNLQQSNVICSQAGWFPSLTHVANDSQGRKKNEEIIAKVTNWSTGGKQYSPKKNLLSEATVETKPESPREYPTSPAQKSGTTAKDTVNSATTVSSILGPEAAKDELVGKDVRKEWNSPARYPPGTKREKKKAKGKSWAQFVCCASSI